MLFAGLAEIHASFKGGVLVPAPQIQLSITLDGSGSLSLATTWPNDIPAGTTLALQAWFLDPSGPLGVTASNAVRATAMPQPHPDYDSGWFPARSDMGPASFHKIRHGLTGLPDRVRVLAMAVDGDEGRAATTTTTVSTTTTTTTTNQRMSSYSIWVAWYLTGCPIAW